MTPQEHVEKAHILAREWFKDHKAKASEYTDLATNCTILVIDWRAPGTGSYAIQYMITRNVLIVVGDVGDAIYGFGCNITPAWLAKIDWHYFAGKCCASETGRDYSMKVPGIKSPVPNVRVIGHYVGLMMAIEQLAEVKT